MRRRVFYTWMRGSRPFSASRGCLSFLNESNNVTGSLILTRSCIERIRLVRSKKSDEQEKEANKRSDAAAFAENGQTVLRVVVTAGGCQGFSYSFLFEPLQCLSDKNDVWLREEGVIVVLSRKAFQLLKGAEIDFKSELKGSAFVIQNNPNSENSCSCGNSFSIIRSSKK
mmetsp:Transcript_4796/g.7163  ORF Transcript_4796/g.7163 Transcript_4796/m.7163 type:complete len:170 (-) Transcript_4796:18-527(-)